MFVASDFAELSVMFVVRYLTVFTSLQQEEQVRAQHHLPLCALEGGRGLPHPRPRACCAVLCHLMRLLCYRLELSRHYVMDWWLEAGFSACSQHGLRLHGLGCRRKLSLWFVPFSSLMLPMYAYMWCLCCFTNSMTGWLRCPTLFLEGPAISIIAIIIIIT